MALLVVQTVDGGSVLVHSSIFDPPFPKRLTPAARDTAWRAVWRRLDDQTPPAKETPDALR
jgi:hypothetical protein